MQPQNRLIFVAKRRRPIFLQGAAHFTLYQPTCPPAEEVRCSRGRRSRVSKQMKGNDIERWGFYIGRFVSSGRTREAGRSGCIESGCGAGMVGSTNHISSCLIL